MNCVLSLRQTVSNRCITFVHQVINQLHLRAIAENGRALHRELRIILIERIYSNTVTAVIIDVGYGNAAFLSVSVFIWERIPE